MRGLVHDRYTCVFWHVSGLHWYDLKADPTPAFSEKEISSSGNPCLFAVTNGIAFVSNAYEGLLLLEAK
jgi:hypothetical protein